MIEGHGDDAYKYKGIKSDFSSNICAHGSHQDLLNHLAAHPELIDHYPEPEAWTLERMLAEKHDVDPGRVIVTSGATEAIYLIAQTFRYLPVIPEPTFSEYADACDSWRNEEPAREVCDSRAVLWLCNPNNPTGEVYDQLYIDRMMAEHELVVIDQSYANYTQRPVCLDCTATNLILIRSMTKDYGVPGLRLGYIIAHESLTERIRRHLRPWSVSALAIEAGKYLLQHDELICRPDLNEAQRLRERLQGIEGIETAPTQTNFMLCKLVYHNTAAELKDYLAKEHHMLIRDASNFKGLTPYHFRVAAQTPEENNALVEAIQRFIKHDQLDNCNNALADRVDA